MKKSLLCVEPSATQQAVLREIADKQGLGFSCCTGEARAIELLAEPTSYGAMVVAHVLDDGESLQVIETARLSPAHAMLPIAFLMGDRNATLAQVAMNAGATEVFLRTELDALAGFVADWSSIHASANYGGRVLLVEDSESHASYVTHLCEALGMRVDVAQDVAAATVLLDAGVYQLILVDIVLKDTKSGISFVKDIRRARGAGQPVLVMSAFDDMPRRLLAMKSGANDFISKPFTPEEFVWRVKKVMQGASLTDAPEAVRADADASSKTVELLKLLSPREYQIFEMIIAGTSDRDIATSLGISFWTVRGHVQRLFEKTGALNRRELMARFINPVKRR